MLTVWIYPEVGHKGGLVARDVSECEVLRRGWIELTPFPLLSAPSPIRLAMESSAVRVPILSETGGVVQSQESTSRGRAPPSLPPALHTQHRNSTGVHQQGHGLNV